MRAATTSPGLPVCVRPGAAVLLSTAAAVLMSLAAWPVEAQPAPDRASAAAANCPSTVAAQYQRLSGFPVDAAAGAIDGLTPLFFPGSVLRLVGARLGLAHGGETAPSDLLPPDELVLTPGRPAQWTLWDGSAPAPTAVVHMVCEYEGGLVMHRPLGRSVRSCRLDTQLAAGGAAAAREPALPRRRLARAVFACR